MAATVPSLTLHNGFKIPVIGLGTSKAPGEAVEAALEAGYRHFDTAYDYGTEASIGEVLKKWLQAGRLRRDELFIVTKLPPVGNRAELVETYLKKSLEALQLSYVDLYLIHFPVGFTVSEDRSKRGIDMSTDHISLWKAMEAQVDAGRARSIGLSNFNARQVKRIVKAARIPPANLQVELNVYFQQRELAAFCKALDVTVCAYAPLGSPGLSKSPKLPLNEPVVQAIAKKHGKTAAQVLLRHIIQRGIIVIPKSSTPARIKENIQVFDFQLDEEDLEKLNALDEGSKVRRNKMRPGSEAHPEYPYVDPY